MRKHDLLSWLRTPNTPRAQSPSQSRVRAEARASGCVHSRPIAPRCHRWLVTPSLQMPDGSRRVVGSTDATRGCKHLCRHCPIVPVYGGTFRAIPIDVVMDDVRAQVAAGAEHISFGDPDFFNGPTHARRLVEAVAKEFPRLTYDVTIKIEHILRHADMLGLLRDTGCLMITSAVESMDDEVLVKLRKGHTRADFINAVGLCKQAGVTLAPTFVPFTPWTTIGGYVDLLEQLDALELAEGVAPIQLAIRLLVTAESKLLELPDIRDLVDPFDAAVAHVPVASSRSARGRSSARRHAGRWRSVSGLARRHIRSHPGRWPRAQRTAPRVRKVRCRRT